MCIDKDSNDIDMDEQDELLTEDEEFDLYFGNDDDLDDDWGDDDDDDDDEDIDINRLDDDGGHCGC